MHKIMENLYHETDGLRSHYLRRDLTHFEEDAVSDDPAAAAAAALYALPLEEGDVELFPALAVGLKAIELPPPASMNAEADAAAAALALGAGESIGAVAASAQDLARWSNELAARVVTARAASSGCEDDGDDIAAAWARIDGISALDASQWWDVLVRTRGELARRKQKPFAPRDALRLLHCQRTPALAECMLRHLIRDLVRQADGAAERAAAAASAAAPPLDADWLAFIRAVLQESGALRLSPVHFRELVGALALRSSGAEGGGGADGGGQACAVEVELAIAEAYYSTLQH